MDGRNSREDNCGVRFGAPAILKTYSTKDVTHVAKTTYWNDLMQKLGALIEVTPADRYGFDAQFRVDAIGPLSIRKTSSMPARIESTARHVAQGAEQRFFLMMPLLGSVAVAHCGRQSILEPGDFVLVDSTAPSRVEFAEPNTSIHIMLSPADLKSRLPSPENLCGLKASRERQFGRVVGSMLEDVWRQVESGFPQEYGPTIAKNILDVIATAYTLQHGTRFAETESIGQRRAHIKRFIEARLGDQGLSSTVVADYFGVSTRYIGMIFEREYEPISAYILRRRLEECAHQLRSVVWESHSVTAISRKWGFRDRAHFSRVFRKRFGMSPREFRRSKSER